MTLLEQAPAAGGGLRAAELEPKLPDRVLDAEIAEVLALGIELKTGVSLGRDLTLDEAVAGYDAVILAIGEFDPEAMRSWGLYVGKRGIEAERHTGRTAMPTVFACGNVTGPGRMAVRSLAQGRIAAIAVDRMLRGAPVTEAPRAYDHRLTGRPSETEMAVFMVDAAPDARREPDDGNAGYTEAEAQAEAARCMHCDCRKAKACKLRLYADTCGAHQHGWKPEKRRAVEMVRSGRVVYEPGKCIACGICVRLTERAREPLGLTFVGRGFDVRVRVPFDAELEQGLQRVAAECVEACPTGALAWRAG